MTVRVRATFLCAALLAAGAAGLATAPAGVAASRISFNATASADASHLVQFVRDAPVAETPLDGGSPYAQANVDSLGNSTGQAAALSPSETVVTAPGVIRGMTGAPVPDYPFFATSRSPTQPKSSVTAGAFPLPEVRQQSPDGAL